MSSDFFLIDINNFFVSCERAFDPKLQGRPVLVLSSNDGCIVARSNEAKAIGIPMGVPLFQCRELVRQHRVQTLSSNFELYADMSRRFFDVLQSLSPDVEIYSVDEAFLHAPDLGFSELTQFGKKIRETVWRHLGLPVSVGIAPTKTLAKIATEVVKTQKITDGVLALRGEKNIDAVLATVPVGDVWGVGTRHSRMLWQNDVKTALDLKNRPEEWVRKKMTIMGSRTQWELKGVSCVDVEDVQTVRKSIVHSRTFGRRVSRKDDLAEAVATYVAGAAEKLRGRSLLAGYVSVFLRTSHDDGHGSTSQGLVLPVASDYTPDLVKAALQCLNALFVQGVSYKKAGVLFGNLTPTENKQYHLFTDSGEDEKKQKAMQALDRIQKKWGHAGLKYAAEGLKPTWRARRDKRSPEYTTNWNDVPIVKAKGF